MAYEPRPMSDPRVLRAIAHPIRGRILDELSATGPDRAPPTSARRSGSRPTRRASTCASWRSTALIVPAPEAARDRRDRVWKAGRRARASGSTSRRWRSEPGGQGGGRRSSSENKAALGAPPGRRGLRVQRAQKDTLQRDRRARRMRLTKDEAARVHAARSTRSLDAWARQDPRSRLGRRPAYLCRSTRLGPALSRGRDGRVIRWGRARTTPALVARRGADALAADAARPRADPAAGEALPGGAVRARARARRSRSGCRRTPRCRRSRACATRGVRRRPSSSSTPTPGSRWRPASSPGPTPRPRGGCAPAASGPTCRPLLPLEVAVIVALLPTQALVDAVGPVDGVELVVWRGRRAAAAGPRPTSSCPTTPAAARPLASARRAAAAARRTAADGGVRRRPRAGARRRRCWPAPAASTTTRPPSWRSG